MCQDDVENYFSFQRAMVSGGKPTTLQFFESSASLETELLLSAEMTDTQGTCGSYDMTALPNLVSIPLIKAKQTAPDNLNYFSEKEVWELGYDDQMTPACVAEGTQDFDETFHDAADKQQLSRHVEQTVEHIDLFSSATILQTCQPILTALNENKNHQDVLLFARKLDYPLRTKFFLQEIGLTISFKKPSINLRLTEHFLFFWKKLLQKILIPESQIKLSSQVLSAFVRKFTKRRCVNLFS